MSDEDDVVERQRRKKGEEIGAVEEREDDQVIGEESKITDGWSASGMNRKSELEETLARDEELTSKEVAKL